MATKPPSGNRRPEGSALLIVLGLLAVLMMLGLTFSVFARTEHAGSTNLKNGAVARQSLQTAIGHVMEAIDLSFGSPSNNWPVCVWPKAWLASSELEIQDYYQSESLADGEAPTAQILTDDAAKFLTPSQLALAKSAAVGWAPIYAAIDSEGPRTAKPSGALVGNIGRDNADSVIGRYAFIALETTGLLDANAAGSVNGTFDGDNRADNTGDIPLTYILPGKNDKAKFESVQDLGNNESQISSVEVPHTLKNATTFVTARNKTTPLSSFADLRAVAGAALDESKPAKPSSNNAADAVKNPFPADLFNTFSASLAGLNPDGQPKIPFPAGSSEAEIRRFAARAFPAMVGVFANARADTSAAGGAALNPSSNDGDQYTFFEGTGKEYSLTRARLATIAAIDAQYDDDIPCRSTAANNYSPLQRLPDLKNFRVNVVDASGDASVATVSDTLPNSIRNGSPLNLPCTENVPMLSRVFAQIQFQPSAPNGITKPNEKDPSTWYVEFEAVLQLYAIAAAQSDETPASCTLEVECEILAASPDSGTVSRPAASGNIAQLIWDPTAQRPHQKWVCPEVDNFVPQTASKTIKFSATGTKLIRAYKEIPFKIQCYTAAGWTPQQSPVAPESDAGVQGRCFEFGGYPFYPATPVAEKDKDTNLFLPIRFKASVKNGSTVVQQVPAPAIDDDAAYRLRVDIGLYHAPNVQMVSSPPAKWGTTPWGRKFAVGWAMCLDPVFAFDTSSLKSSGSGAHQTIQPNNGCNFWVNNMASFCGNGPMWNDLNIRLSDPAKAWDDLNSNETWNYLQLHWLFEDKYAGAPFLDWMFRGAKYSMRPDMFHTDDLNGGNPFCWKNGSISDSKLKKQLPSPIPNRPFDSVGQMGNVRIGPYETLATVRSYRWNTGGVTDFHRVLDYFSATSDRSDPPTVNTSTGAVDWSGSGELFSSIARGRVNLNMPPLVRWSSKKGIRATTDDMLPNPYPIIAAMQGATPALNFSLASKIATRIAGTAGEEVENTKGFRKPDGTAITARRTVMRRLSEIGWAEINGRNPILTDIILSSSAAADSDAAREAYIGQCANAFTTRGQTFIVVVRADAYTPRYGEEASTGDGTTLATTHAILELFRDPEYARYPDGSPLEDEEGHPVYFHNWYIKSFHVL